MTTDYSVHRDLLTTLANRQLPTGGWAALASSSQAALEPTCLALLAVGPGSDDVPGRAQRALLNLQNRNGSWPAFAGDDQEGCWATALAAIALRDLVPAIPTRLRGLHWLLDCAGRESHWLWRWKFRTIDRHVRFDPEKFGWPWEPDTVSWVVPTSFAILALNQLPCSCSGFERSPWRVDRGVQMLMDRACPRGGWNAGNSIVYGAPLSPHPDDTAIALLALTSYRREPIVRQSVDWLEQVAPALGAPWSLAWTILALAAHGRATTFLCNSLAALPGLSNTKDTSTLAVASLALDHQSALAALGVTS